MRPDDDAHLAQAVQDMLVQYGVAREADVPQKMARLLVAQPLDRPCSSRKNRAALRRYRRTPAAASAPARRCPAGIPGCGKYTKAVSARTGPGAAAPAPAVPVRCLRARRSLRASTRAHAHLRAAARGQDAVAQLFEDDRVALVDDLPELGQPLLDGGPLPAVVPLQLSG